LYGSEASASRHRNPLPVSSTEHIVATMEDTMTTELNAGDPVTEPSDEGKDTGRGLRAQLEKQIEKTNESQANNQKLRTQLLDRSYQELGLDPTKLVGKAISEKYEGEPTTEALADFAKEEYGYIPVAASEPHPLAGQISTQQAALDQVGQTAGSVPVLPTENDALAQAEAAGDYATAMQIKGDQVAAMFNR
jgi:hypothetical protein